MYPYQMPPKQESFLISLLKTWATTTVVMVTIGAVMLVGFVISIVVLVGVLGATAGEAPGTITVGDSVADFASGKEGSENILLSIKLSGFILGEEGEEGGFFDEDVTYGYELKRLLNDAAEDDRVKGVMLDIMSGGGTIYGSNAIFDGVGAYRDKSDGRPIISFVEGFAASGAYLSAVATDEIVADVGSDVGSIGVIYGPFEFFDKPTAFDGGLLGGGIVTQNGIETTYFTAGRGKDMGNPFRRLTPEEIRITQLGVDNNYELFVTHVSKRRNIPPETIKTQIGAHMYDNATAIELKLLDKTLNRNEANDRLADLAGVPGKNWAVYEVAQQSSNFSLLSRLLDSRGAGGDRADGSSSTSCRLHRQYLAYYGNVGNLCLS